MFRTLFVIIPAILLISCIGKNSVQPKTSPVSYQAMLGKSAQYVEIADFLIDNECTLSGPMYICQTAGIAFWIDRKKIIKAIYLYLNTSGEISPYRGELPYGLKFYDSMEGVEYKMRRQGIGNDGLPNEGSSPDYLHYWADYKEAGIIIVYNGPYPDEDASIYAVLITE